MMSLSPQPTPAPFTPRSGTLPSGMVLAGRYEIVSLLGEGGMGRVYRVRDRVLDEDVALKVLHDDLTQDPEALARFRREAKLARRVTHPNVARVFDVSEDGPLRLLTMEWVEGASLADVLDRERVFPTDWVIEIASQICDGLAAAHKAGVVHRDLKPQNIIVDVDGRVVITDFGIARAVGGASMTATQGTVGTPTYMAPEQVRSQRDVDARADVYAFGAMLYELLTGELPWDGSSVYVIAAARLSSPPPDPRDVTEVEDALAELVLRCMARDREERFADAHELRRALRTIRREVLEHRATAPPPGRSLRAGGRSIAVLVTGDVDLAAGIRAFIVDGVRATRGLTYCPTPRDAVSTAALQGLGATALLTVQVLREGDEVVLEAELRETQTRRVSWSGLHRGAIGDSLDAALLVVDELTDSLGLPPPPVLPRRSLPPAEAEALFQALRLHESWQGEEDNDRAISLFEKAFREQPHDPWVNAGYASALLRRYVEADGFGYDLDDALEMAERALAVAPELTSARSTLAEVLLELGHPLRACREALTVLSEQPQSAKPISVLARSWLLVGEPARAVELFRRASALGVMRRVRNDFALALALAGAREEALSVIDGASERERKVWHHWWVRARLAVWIGDDERRAEVLEGAASTFYTHRDDMMVVVGAMNGAGATKDALRHLASLSEATREGVRRRAQILATQVELLLAAEGPRALERVKPSRVTDMLDLAWLEHGPAMHVSRRSFPHRSLVSHLTQTHASLRRLLSSSRHA